MTTTSFEIYGLFLRSDPDRIRYVGQTIMGSRKRFWAHTNTARNGTVGRRSQPVTLWIKKHGVESVDYRVLEAADDPDHLQTLEIFWIAQMRDLGQADLNVHFGGVGGRKPLSPDEKVKRAERMAKLRQDPRWEARRLERLRESKQTPEYRARMSAIKSGSGNSQYGRVYSPEERKAMSLSKTTVLTEGEVVSLKALVRSGVSQKMAAEQFGVKPSTVSHIMAGRRWSWIE